MGEVDNDGKKYISAYTRGGVPGDRLSLEDCYKHIEDENGKVMPFIAFKSIHTGAGGGLWEKMFRFFRFKRTEFLTHYHKRSNIESTISMIKAKFRDHVHSKTDVAMKNEVLCKVLCHNICCFISAIYELNISPTFTELDDARHVSKLAA